MVVYVHRLLQAFVIVNALNLALLIYLAPMPVIPVAVILAFALVRRRKALTSHGSARFAETKDLKGFVDE